MREIRGGKQSRKENTERQFPTRKLHRRQLAGGLAASIMYTRVCIVVIARVVPEYRSALRGCRHPLALQLPSLAVGATGSVRGSREKGRQRQSRLASRPSPLRIGGPITHAHTHTRARSLQAEHGGAVTARGEEAHGKKGAGNNRGCSAVSQHSTRTLLACDAAKTDRQNAN